MYCALQLGCRAQEERKIMEQTLSQQISSFLQLMEQAQKNYAYSAEDVQRMELLTQDYLHKLELQSCSYHTRTKVANAIRVCRTERRQHKDNAVILEPLVNFLQTEKGKLLISQLQQTLGAVRKAERATQNRQYHPRVLSTEEYEETLPT